MVQRKEKFIDKTGTTTSAQQQNHDDGNDDHEEEEEVYKNVFKYFTHH